MNLVRFRHKGLKRLYARDDFRGVPAGTADRLRKMLFALETAERLSQVGALPGLEAPSSQRRARGILESDSDWKLTFGFPLRRRDRFSRRYRPDRLPLRGDAMPMKNPPHPGDFIKTEIIAALGLSVSAAAAVLRVRRATLSDLLNCKSALTPEMALRIEKAFGPDMDHLLRMQLAYDIARMRQRAGRIAVKRYVAA